MFSLILHEINFYLNLILSFFSQSLFRISNLCQEKRFSSIHENNKIRNYKKDHHLILWQMEKELHLTVIITQKKLELYWQSKNIDSITILPSQYHNYLNVFFKKKADILPLHWVYNYVIHFKKSIQPPVFALYSINCDEALKLCWYLNENFSKKFI